MKKSNKKPKMDFDFQNLAEKIDLILQKNEEDLTDQKEQVERVFILEKRFQERLKKYAKSKEVYKSWLHTIRDGNILLAKSYFRETIQVFNAKISGTIKDGNIENLMNFHPNYYLIKHIVDNWGGPLPKGLQETFDQFLDARRILIENNIPLAINRAKLFYRKTPKNHMELLDFIDVCVYGLAVGIDKYVGEYKPVWRSVCIGRMVGFMIEEYNKSFIRMFPNDRKILYRINSIKHRSKVDDFNQLLDLVNKSFDEDRKNGKPSPKHEITLDEMHRLLNGCGYIDLEAESSEVGNSEYGSEGKANLYNITPDLTQDTESEVIDNDLVKKLYESISKLSLTEQKIIRMKGVMRDYIG